MNVNIKINLLEIVDSTISYAKNYFNINEIIDHNIIFLAEQQTKGVGKQGKTWYSPKGNVYLSAIIKSSNGYNFNNIEDINIFNLLVSNALLQTFKSLITENNQIFSKWPNDLLVNSAKISGILLEKLDDNHILVSVGANLVNAPMLEEYKTISLASISNITNDFTPLDFVMILFKNIIINQQKTKPQIVELWLKNAYNLNKEITIKLANQNKTGIFRGINQQGLLLLETANNKIEVIAVGEVYV
ncbi:biotin--[acetyl-CoA-carboxylase] ligase [Rickettsiales bacterium LUAb2]